MLWSCDFHIKAMYTVPYAFFCVHLTLLSITLFNVIYTSTTKWLRPLKHLQDIISHFPWKTSFKKSNVKSVILKDYVQEDGWEPALIIDPQALGQTSTQPGLTALDQSPLYCSAHSGKTLLIFIHWTDASRHQGPLTQSYWPRMDGQHKHQNGLCQMWDIGHQPLIIIIPSYYLILGECTCWVVWKNLIYTCCPGTILNRIFIHSQKYHLIRDVRAHSSSQIMHPLGFMCFIPLTSGHFLYYESFQLICYPPLLPPCFSLLLCGIHSIVK